MCVEVHAHRHLCMYELVNKYTQFPTLALSKGLLILLGTTEKTVMQFKTCNVKSQLPNAGNNHQPMRFTLYYSQTLVENRTNTQCSTHVQLV